MSQPLCKCTYNEPLIPEHRQNIREQRSVTHTFEKRAFSALCVVDPNNSFFVSCCQDVLQVSGYKERERWERRKVNDNSHRLQCALCGDKLQVGYRRRKIIQMVVQSLLGFRRRCVHRVECTGSPAAGSSEDTWTRSLQGGLCRKKGKKVRFSFIVQQTVSKKNLSPFQKTLINKGKEKFYKITIKVAAQTARGCHTPASILYLHNLPFKIKQNRTKPNQPCHCPSSKYRLLMYNFHFSSFLHSLTSSSVKIHLYY